MSILSPMDERRSRVLAGALLAPAVLVALDLVREVMSASRPLTEYFSVPLFTVVLLAYLGSALAGGLAAAVRWVLRAPLQAEVVVPLFAASAAALALLTPRPVEVRLAVALFVAVVSLPVSVTYCLIAGVPLKLFQSVRERPRILAAALVAPAALLPLELVRHTGYFAVPGHAAKYFPGVFPMVAACAYLASGLVAALASALRRWLRAPLRGGVVVPLFALSAALFGLLVDVEWAYRPVVALGAATLSLPVSLTYCAVAGVRWR